MKRSFMLAALSLSAVILVFSSTAAQSQTAVRAFTTKVTISVTPKRDRTKPYKFKTKGRVVPPSTFCGPGVVPTTAANCIPIKCLAGQKDLKYCTRPPINVICSGTVNVRFKRGAFTVSSKNVSVKADCTYSSKTTIKKRGKLKVRARFQGNAVLRSKSSATRAVRAG